MKAIIISWILFFSVFGHAGTSLVKVCATETPDPNTGEIRSLDFEIYSDEHQEWAKVISVGGSYIENKVRIVEDQVRPDLHEDPPSDGLNFAEYVIAYAMDIEDDPVLDGLYFSGIDLSLVRAAKIYILGEVDRYSSTLIVEAYDESGQVMGSFLGGLFVTPCLQMRQIGLDITE